MVNADKETHVLQIQDVLYISIAWTQTIFRMQSQSSRIWLSGLF